MQAKNSLHAEARALAQEGIRVFPCLPGTKTPATPRGFHDASSDLAQIDLWWGQNPEYNIALSPGHQGWTVVDLDEGEVGEATWAKLQEENGNVRETYTVRTPKGGRHLYFVGDLRSTVRRLGRGVDTRGIGGYVLVPPSVVDVRCGKPAEHWGHYHVERDLPDADLPEWLPSAAAAFHSVSKSATDAQDLPHQIARAVAWLEARETEVQGAGADMATYKAACWLSDFGLSEETIVQTMLDHYKIEPRDDRFEAFIRRKVHNAVSGTDGSGYKQNEGGAYASGESAEDAFKGYIEASTPPQGQKPKFYAYSIEEIMERPPIEWLSPGLFPARGLGMLIGLPGTLKTFACVSLGLTIATGVEGWGRPAAEAADVLYIAAESPEEMVQDRVKAWLAAHDLQPADASRFRIIEDVPLAANPDDIVQLIEQQISQGCRPKLIVLDTLFWFMAGLSENDTRDVSQALLSLKRLIREFGSLVLIVHHIGKNQAGARGSSSLEGALDTLIEAKRDGQALALWWQKQKNAKTPTHPLTFEARDVFGSTVLFPTTQAEHRAMTETPDTLSPANIGGALVRLQRANDGELVTTHVLAQEALPMSDVESPEERQASVARIERVLKMRAKPGKDLAGYVQWQGGQWMWGIPKTVH